MKELVVFTDLDGTLLDQRSYSVRSALSAIDLLVRRGQPVIPVSSKTAAEIRYWSRLLTIDGPFICENGCGIVVPGGCFTGMPDGAIQRGEEWIISLGSSVDKVRQGLEKLSNIAHFSYRSFAQMTEEEAALLTGLTGEELNRCLEREYDEPFQITGEHDVELISNEAEKIGFHFTRGGRFFHLTGGCHKGEAVRILVDLYRKEKDDLLIVGIGDSLNDLPMFMEVDVAFLVQKPDGSYDRQIPEDVARRVKGIGPHGWRAAVEEVMALGY